MDLEPNNKSGSGSNGSHNASHEKTQEEKDSSFKKQKLWE